MLLTSSHSVLFRVSIAVTTHYDHKQLVEKEFISAYNFLFTLSFRGKSGQGLNRAGTQNQEGMQGSDACWLAHQGSPSLLSYGTR